MAKKSGGIRSELLGGHGISPQCKMSHPTKKVGNCTHLVSNSGLAKFYSGVVLDLSSICDAKMFLIYRAQLTACEFIVRDLHLRKSLLRQLFSLFWLTLDVQLVSD